MRLTTKFIIGIFLSIFLLSLLFIIIFSFSDRRYYERPHPFSEIKLPQSLPASLNIEDYRVIVLEPELIAYDGNYYMQFSDIGSGLFIQPAPTTADNNKLLIPESIYEFTTTQACNDTLTIKIKLDELRNKYMLKEETEFRPHKQGIKYAHPFSGFNLNLFTSNVNVVNKMSYLETQIKNLETDSILIHSSGTVIFEDCMANFVAPTFEGNYRELLVKNCVIKTLKIDFDQMGSWNISDSDIQEEILTGSHTHNSTNDRNESRNITWLPKNKDAKLILTLKGDPAQIIFP